VLRYVLTRLVSIVPILLGISLISFLMFKLIPGDAAQVLSGPYATGEDIAALRRVLGLDQPIHVQYFIWLGRALQGDLGHSLEMRQPVVNVVLNTFGNTLMLNVAAIFISVLIGMPAGIISAIRRGSLVDRLTMVVALFGNSMPAFWLGLVLMEIFALWLHLLPSSGMYNARGGGGLPDLLSHLVLPALTLGTLSVAIIARMTRASMLEVIGQDYVRVARAKGLAEYGVVMRHALKNALLPIITVIGLQFSYLLGGAVIVETVFSWPGLGFQLFRAISTRDVPLVQGTVLLIATLFVVINLLVDLLYIVADPRIRYGAAVGRR
jgi:peptide/nickel transport system permease protein